MNPIRVIIAISCASVAFGQSLQASTSERGIVIIPISTSTTTLSSTSTTTERGITIVPVSTSLTTQARHRSDSGLSSSDSGESSMLYTGTHLSATLGFVSSTSTGQPSGTHPSVSAISDVSSSSKAGQPSGTHPSASASSDVSSSGKAGQLSSSTMPSATSVPRGGQCPSVAIESIVRFCSGQHNLIVPSEYSNSGKTVGQVQVWITGFCDPPERVPMDQCFSQFLRLCYMSSGTAVEGGFGQNKCQRFQIGAVYTGSLSVSRASRL